MLCHRNINHLRKSLSLSSIQIHSNCILYHPSNSFCAVTKLQSPSIANIFNEEGIINSIKQTHKSEQLSDYLANLNLKKSGNKDTKIQRLIDHFNENTQNLNEMNEISLKSYCDLFNLSINDNTSKTDLISILSEFTTNDDAQNTENVIETAINSEEIGEEEPFKFQMDQEREDQVLIENELNDLKLIEIDEKQSFLHKYPIDICSKVSYPNGSEIIFETSRIGHLSESAIIVNCKGTIVYTTAISKLQKELKFEDRLDLKVDAHERSWSRGYIPSGMQRSDGGITDYEILLCRMIDRSIRPLFIVDDNDNNNNKILPSYEVQILSNLLSCDDIYDTQILAINGASAAIYLSSNIDIGNNGPIGAVRVIIDKNDEMICNPTKIEIEDEESKCNLLYVGTKENCVMIETDANRIDQDKYCKLIQFAQENVTEIVKCIEELKERNDSLNNREKEIIQIDEDIINKYNKLSEYKGYLLNEDIIKNTESELFKLYSNDKLNKNERNLQRNLCKKQMISSLFEQVKECKNGYDLNIDLTDKEWNDFYGFIFYEMDHKQFRNAYILNNKRCDGRKFDELRDLNAMIDILPSCHGSSLFSRGNTQNLCSATLGPPRLARMRDLHKANHPEIKHRLYFQYEMPPSATNEIKAIQSKNRRAIGHANIALNALSPLLPSFDLFPYSIRIYSHITASDGSSSMASVCGGSLALMDAGIPMIESAAGISIGLINNILLTDIAGIEDHFGDMDFKIAGTRNGINSVQLDIKKGDGIPIDIILNAIKQSYNTRIKILDYMDNYIIKNSKDSLKKHAPRVEIIDIPFRDLPRVIGSGGAVKQKIQIDTKCDINIFWEEERVEITAPNIMALNKAKRAIQDVIGSQCRIGDIITGKIINIQSYGVMIEIDDGSEHLVHISQWIDNMDNNEYSEGQNVDIMCIGYLGENRPNFSRKAAIWQISDDPEDRARLRLMLDSLRPPARSRGHIGSTSSVAANNNDNDNNNDHDIKNREPMSIFNNNIDNNNNDDNIDIDIDEDEDEDNDTTHPLILPPKKPFSFSSRDRERKNGQKQTTKINNNNDSIKHLIDNISLNKPISNEKSRFSNLYKDIHSIHDNDNNDNNDNDKKKENISSNFSQLIDSMDSSRNDNNNNNNNDSIENWKNFTKDLMSSNPNIIEKDDDGDDLLTDLFGDQHKSTNITPRAQKLMNGVKELIDDLNHDENNNNDNDNDKWPWMQHTN